MWRAFGSKEARPIANERSYVKSSPRAKITSIFNQSNFHLHYDFFINTASTHTHRPTDFTVSLRNVFHRPIHSKRSFWALFSSKLVIQCVI